MKNPSKPRKSQRRVATHRAVQPDAHSVVGVVGMGLMGTSISACLLGAGHKICCIDSNSAKLQSAPDRLLRSLEEAHSQGLIKVSPALLMKRVTISDKFIALKVASAIVESTVEDLTVKREVIAKVEEVVSSSTLIGSNTSAIPVTELQRNAIHPERIIGLHWAEPANVTRFMEIICGDKTSLKTARRAEDLARRWGKEPSVLRKDIRGFITNRIMYAMLREAFYLVESGFATVADVDRSLRNDLGYWITFAGPFRFMDLTGIPAYASVMKDLLPELSCAMQVPDLMRKIVKSGARGVSNAKGFYRYTPQQAKHWEELFVQFSYQIRRLAGEFPDDIGDKTISTSNRLKRARRATNKPRSGKAL
ncbi:MAG: 3-hydroxyacyl-CoA dehydrogenase family protein [Acidobacteriaceae bacterium]